MSGRKPNLFLIGAMKSGTTYLCKRFKAHPDIFMCEPDEPSYFVEPRDLKAVWPDMWRRGFWRSEDLYLDLFRDAGDAPILGEASTNYTKLPVVAGVPDRIAAFNPQARFIYLVRDPAERAISHYWHMVRHGDEHRPILQALRCDPQYINVSYYAMQIKPFLERFGHDRVRVIVHERLIVDPASVMRGVYEWLGVDAAAADFSGFGEPENVAPEVVSMPLWGGVPRRLRQTPALQRAINWIPQAAHQALHRLTTREVRRSDVDVVDAIAFLRATQAPQTDELAQLLGCSFPEWATFQCHRPHSVSANREITESFQ